MKIKSFTSTTEISEVIPLPTNFEEFLPYAIDFYNLNVNAVIVKKYIDSSKEAKPKAAKSPKSKSSASQLEYAASKSNHIISIDEKLNDLLIYSYYDAKENLVELEFPRPVLVPRQILKIIALIVQFHSSLNKISIHRGGADKFITHELNNILCNSFITEINLDGNVINECNWYVILQGHSQLKYLSLSRCKIDDFALRLLMNNLKYDQPASKTLMLLNLTTNFITDIGARCVGETLKTNRTLRYLNLADNQITDVGCGYILEALTKFYLTEDEIFLKKCRRFNFAELYNNYLNQCLEKLIAIKHDDDISRFSARKGKKEKPKRRNSSVLMENNKKNETASDVATNTVDLGTYKLAKEMALDLLGPDIEPFSNTNTECTHGFVSCEGNMVLSYLNVAYNKIEFPSLWKIIDVFFHHSQVKKVNQVGLVKVVIEGNLLPVACSAFGLLEETMDRIANASQKSGPIKKK